MATNNTYYINGSSLANATCVFDDAAMTTRASQGLYTDGEVIRYQSLSGNQALFADQSSDCNACTTSCSSNILFSQSYVTAASMQGSVSFGNDVGAIKVEISGVGSKPVGVDLKVGSTRYNYFSSTNPNATPQRYNAPSLLIKSYFWSVNGVGFCSNWANNSANLDILHYNPNSGLWEDTGSDIVGQTLTNKMTNGFPATPPTGVGSVAGNLVTYIPKASSNPSLLLDVIFETPCGPIVNSQGIINGPTLTISCPVQLSSFVSTAVHSAGHSNACNDSNVTQSRYIGPVRSNSPGVLALGDFLFNDINGVTATPDGYYKTLGSNLVGVSTSFGSFKIENGVVTEIQSC